MTMKSIGTVASVATVLFCAPSLTAARAHPLELFCQEFAQLRGVSRVRSALRQLLL